MSTEVRSEPLVRLLRGVVPGARRAAFAAKPAPLSQAALIATRTPTVGGWLPTRATSLATKVHEAFGVNAPARIAVDAWSFGAAVSGAGFVLATKLLAVASETNEIAALLALESLDDILASPFSPSDAFIATNPLFGSKYLANDVFIVEAGPDASPMVLAGLVFVPVHRAKDEIDRLVRLLDLEAVVQARGFDLVDQHTPFARLHVQSMLATLARAVERVPKGMAVHWCS